MLVGCLSAGVLARGFDYPNFTAPTGLVFQADARLLPDCVRIAPSATGMAGGAWFNSKQNVRDGFDTTFRFRITDKIGHGSDGLAFVLQNSATPHIGLSGYHLGFARSANCFVVKFDDYHWHRDWHVQYDEVAVTSSGLGQAPEAVGDPLGTVTAPVLFSDGKVHTARVRYVPRELNVFLDDLERPLLTVELNLEQFIALDNGRAWIGFTASTGADAQNHDLLSWSFGPPAEMPKQRSLASVSPGSRSGAVNAAPTKVEPEVIAVPVVDDSAKPGQPRLGLPPTISLSHRVYASTDMVNWTLVTNLSLYFSEPGATDYDHRFYIFREK